MNHKRKRPKHQRAGCLLCKPHKHDGAKKTARGGDARRELHTREDLFDRELTYLRGNGPDPLCHGCGETADWLYMPGNDGPSYCNGCVPRGCSCQEDPNDPCCEYVELPTEE